jgi:hypothetical protein
MKRVAAAAVTMPIVVGLAGCGGGSEREALPDQIASCLRDAGWTADVNSEPIDMVEATEEGVDSDNVNFKTPTGRNGFVAVTKSNEDARKLVGLEQEVAEFEPSLSFGRRGRAVWVWEKKPNPTDDRRLRACLA